MRYLRAADVLLLLNQDGTVLQIPGKFYDYLAAGSPILALSTNEETNRIVEENGAGVAVFGAPLGHLDLGFISQLGISPEFQCVLRYLMIILMSIRYKNLIGL